jgi:hypothetical protein
LRNVRKTLADLGQEKKTDENKVSKQWEGEEIQRIIRCG